MPKGTKATFPIRRESETCGPRRHMESHVMSSAIFGDIRRVGFKPKLQRHSLTVEIPSVGSNTILWVRVLRYSALM